MKIICLDTEFTGTAKSNEILELSMLNEKGDEIWNQLYKPKRCRRWPFSQKVHGISPEMVEDKPYFAEHLDKLQKIFDSAELIIGFAINNDIKQLSEAGISGLEGDRIFDVREQFWAIRGGKHSDNQEDMDVYAVPSLIKCATECGFEWENVRAHSAFVDAMATLFCYKVLIEEYMRDKGIVVEDANEEQEKEVIEFTRNKVALAIYEHERVVARGYMYLFLVNDLYRVEEKHQPMTDEQIAKKRARGYELIHTLQVEDRWKAHYEIIKKYRCRQERGMGTNVFWKLEKKDIEYFKKYTNEFTGDSKLYKYMLENEYL